MLNHSLKLREDFFEKSELKAIRDGYGQALVELGRINQDVVVLTADLKESTRCEAFAKEFPDRFFECGVAEQNMAAVAAGLAESGKIPFISSYAVFSPGKNWETIRTTIIYNKANVKIAGHHSGVVTGPDGCTHQATEDVASVRAWPGLTIFSPCDAEEARKATLAAAKIDGPVYLRFVRDKTPVITTEQTSFELNKAQIFWQSKLSKVAILATGHLVAEALSAARDLELMGIGSLVVNVSTIKPLDEAGLLSVVRQTGAVVTVEDHQVIGGLGSAVAELLAKELPTPMEFIGLQDIFAESGKPAELIKKYQLDKQAIIEAVKKVIPRKN